MKKILITLAIVSVSALAIAADTLVTGFSSEPKVGTFKVTTDGSVATLTVDKIVVTSAATGPFGTNTATGALSSNLTALGGTTGSFQFIKPNGSTGTVYFATGIITNSP